MPPGNKILHNPIETNSTRFPPAYQHPLLQSAIFATPLTCLAVYAWSTNSVRLIPAVAQHNNNPWRVWRRDTNVYKSVRFCHPADASVDRNIMILTCRHLLDTTATKQSGSGAIVLTVLNSCTFGFTWWQFYKDTRRRCCALWYSPCPVTWVGHK